ncbi:MAG: TMEM165/GDT1 family protein [Deltaproteobacteria bacterium]|nr:TMEM165/GDT1 family protein [Deltaproteobacteria bacterium]
MDWKVLGTTFGIVFLAELGDKTQLAALALAGRTGKPWAVFLGASAALVLVTLIGVAAGALLGKYLPEKAVRLGAALLFVAVGAYLLWGVLFAGRAPGPG